MSAEQDRVRVLAERIARRVSQSEDDSNASPNASASDEPNDDMAAMRKSLDELKRKLATIEEQLSHEKDASVETLDIQQRNERNASEQERQEARAPSAVRSPWLSGVYVPATHPSLEKFGVEEAAVSELVDYFEKEKVCELEPGGKPCNHCAMCNTRGF